MKSYNKYTGATQEYLPFQDNKWNTVLENPSVELMEQRFLNIPEVFEDVNMKRFLKDLKYVSQEIKDFVWNKERVIISKPSYIHWYEVIILN